MVLRGPRRECGAMQSERRNQSPRYSGVQRAFRRIQQPFTGCCGHLYDAGTRRLYLLASDGFAAVCITVAGANSTDAAKMIGMFDAIEDGPVGMESAMAIAASVTGRNVSLVH